MSDLRAQLEDALQGRVCVMGVGNVDHGDDGFGVCLAETLAADGVPDVKVVGKSPERWVGRVAEEGFDTILFLDAVDFGSTSGSLLLLDGRGIEARFPQISTHKISLGLLARCVEGKGATRAWLLGVQPESLHPSAGLSPRLETTLRALCELLCEVLARRPAEAVAGGQTQ